MTFQFNVPAYPKRREPASTQLHPGKPSDSAHARNAALIDLVAEVSTHNAMAVRPNGLDGPQDQRLTRPHFASSSRDAAGLLDADSRGLA